ncbi:MAG: energy transducer TonB [Bacteroidota bacterium]
MEPKKHPEADLEKKRGLYLQIGLIIALAITWLSLEWKSYDTSAYDLGDLMLDDIEEEIIPITERDLTPPPPPPPMEELIIVEDETEIEEELDVEDMEVSEETEIAKIEEEVEIFDEHEIFTIVEEMPQFGSGEGDLLNYLQQNIKYPQMAKESGISGTVYVTFVVNPKGEITNVKVLRGIGGGCDKEAIRVVSAMPKWKPGKQRGKPVSVQYNLPVRFVLR